MIRSFIRNLKRIKPSIPNNNITADPIFAVAWPHTERNLLNNLNLLLNLIMILSYLFETLESWLVTNWPFWSCWLGRDVLPYSASNFRAVPNPTCHPLLAQAMAICHINYHSALLTGVLMCVKTASDGSNVAAHLIFYQPEAGPGRPTANQDPLATCNCTCTR